MASLATAAAATAALTYLDGRYHLSKDIAGIYKTWKNQQAAPAAVKANRISLFNYFLDNVARLPPTEECIWSRDGGIWTWQQTYDAAARYATFMREELGVQGEELIGFYYTNGVPYVHSLLAAWAIGTAPAQINYNLGGDGLVHCVKTSGTRILLVDEDSDCQSRIEEVRGKLEGLGIRIVVMDAAMREKIMAMQPTRIEDQNLRQHVLGSSTLMLIYTSGTTGFPKATPFTHDRLRMSMGSFIEGMGMRRGPGGTRFYIPMPLYHGTASHVAIMCLCGGAATLCIAKKFSTRHFWNDVRDSRSNAFVYVGETVRYLLAAPPSPKDKDNTVELAFGNGMRPEVWTKFQERFGVDMVTEFFGSSEGVLQMYNFAVRGPFLRNAVAHHGAIVRLIYHNILVPVQVDHETGSIYRDPQTGFAKRVPYDQGGEIIVKVDDPAVFAGYWKNQEATDKRFARDVFKKGDLYYKSGDALRRDADGRWFFLDRLGDTFRWKSENVSTAEVSTVLGNHPSITEANVYGVSVPNHEGRAGCAALTLSSSTKPADFDYAALLAYLRKQLPKYAVPVFLRVVNGEMARTDNMKQSKVVFRAEGVDLEKVAKGKSPGDRLMWVRPGGSTYEDFGEREWEMLKGEKARL